MTEVRLGVIGVGDVAQRDYLPELGRLHGKARLVAVASRGAERAQLVAEKYGAVRWTTQWKDVLRDDVDVVLNLTPIPSHAEITLAALANGKHVYTEKPLCADTATGDLIRKTAAQQGLVVVAAPSVLLFPQVRRAAQLLADGSIGAVRSARAQAIGGMPPWDGYISDPSPFFAVGGGPLRDVGVYPLHAITGLLGPVRRVAAVSQRTQSGFVPRDGPMAGHNIPIGVDDDWQLVMQLESGALATVSANFNVRAPAGPEMELFGPDGTLTLSLLDVSAPLRLLAAGESGWRDEHADHARSAGPDHILGVEHLIECVRDGLPPIASVDHAIHVIEVLGAAEQSAATGRTIDVTSSFSMPTLAQGREGTDERGA